MYNIKIITKRELLRYFSSPLAYVFTVIFLSLMGACTFYIGNLFELGQADLSAFFRFHPWLYMLLIPAISMRLWAEERKTGTIVQLLTLPISTTEAVLGKYFAALIVIAISLFLTFPIWITVNYLGSPDNGVIFAGYLVSLLMAASYLSIGAFISAVTKNQIIAFVLTVTVCFLFTFSGLEIVLNFFRGWASQFFVETIASFSFLSHFSSVKSGIIKISDIIFFISIIAFWITANVVIVEVKTKQANLFTQDLDKPKLAVIIFSLAIILFVSINQIAKYSFKSIGFDLTKEKLYTVSDISKEVILSIDEPIIVNLFFSKELGEINSFYKRYFTKTVNILESLEDISNGMLKINIYDPKPFSSSEDKAITLGLQNVPLVNLDDVGYFGLSVTNSVDKSYTIPFLTLSRENYIEYDIIRTIYKAVGQNKKIIAVISDTTFAGKKSFAKWVMYDKISEFYNIDNLGINFEKIPEYVDAIMVIHPEKLKKKQLYAIDQYMVRGGNAFVFVDPVPEATYETAPLSGVILGSDNKILKNLGIEFNPDVVIGDLKAARKVDASEKGRSIIVDDITSIAMEDRNFDKENQLFLGINSIFMSTVGEIKKQKNTNLSFVPLIVSNKETMEIKAKSLRPKINSEKLINNFVSSDKKRVIAAYLQGNVISSFEKKIKDTDVEFIKKSKNISKIIAVADIDLLQDLIWVKRRPFYGRELHQSLANNADFVINALDSLTNTVSLTSLRGRGFSSKPFTKVLDMQKNADLEYRAKTKEILFQINKTKEKLEQISKYSQASSNIISISDKETIINYKQDLIRLNKELRKINVELKKNVSFISKVVKFINIYAVSIVILLFLLIYKIRFYLKYKKKHISGKIVRKATKQELRKIFFLSILTILSVIMAIVFSKIQKSHSDDVVEKASFFENFEHNVKDIKKIIVSDKKGNLELVYKDNFWQISSFYNYPVSSLLMKSYFLSLEGLNYYEKKTSLENRFYKLGLQDISKPFSKATEHKILDENNNVFYDVLFGKKKKNITSQINGIFARNKGDSDSWLLKGNIYVPSSDPYDWIGKQLLEVPYYMMSKVEITKDNKKLYDLKSKGNNLFVEKAYNGYKKIPQEDATGVISHFAYFRFLEILPKKELKLSKPIATFKIFTKETLVIEALMYKYGKDFWVELSFDGSQGSGAYAEIYKRSKGWVYKIDSQNGKYILEKLKK